MIAAITVMAVSCDDDDETTPVATSSNVEFHLEYSVDGSSLLWDSILYLNDAGNNYEVSKLLYYLSNVSLIKSDSTLLKLKDYQYVDASIDSCESFTVQNVPVGEYIGMKFNIGLDSTQNLTGALPNTPENQGMEWPDMMGGGYHFMKFEGHYLDGATETGFAMHLGRNMNLVTCIIYHPVTVGSSGTMVHMNMNLNEWFRNPDIYDFNVDGPSSMGSMPAMAKLTRNGVDVFDID